MGNWNPYALLDYEMLQPLWKIGQEFLRMVMIESLSASVILFLSIYSREIKMNVHTNIIFFLNIIFYNGMIPYNQIMEAT